MDNKDKFFRIPNNFIVTTKDTKGETIQPIIKQTGYKELIATHATLMTFRNMFGEVNTTLSLLLQNMDISTRSENINKYKTILSILLDKDLSDYKPNDMITVDYNPFELDDDSNPTKYFTLSLDRFNKLIDLGNKRAPFNHLNVYCYISARMFKNKSGIGYDLFGQYETCSPSYEDMTSTLRINRTDLSKILDELVDEELIYYDNAGRYTYSDNPDSKRVKQARNTYITTDRQDYIIQVDKSIQYYKSRTNFKWL